MRNVNQKPYSLFTFNKKYFAFAVVLLFIEVLIAAFAHDRFVRPYLGDVLVVMLIYCFLKSFLNLRANIAGMIVLAFSFAIEFLQLFNVADRLHLGRSSLGRIVLGASFEWADMLAYVCGIALVLIFESVSGKYHITH